MRLLPTGPTVSTVLIICGAEIKETPPAELAQLCNFNALPRQSILDH